MKDIIQSRLQTKGTQTSQETSEKEGETARQQQRSANQENSESQPHRHTAKP